MNDPITFDGRVAVVTGGGGGLGRTYCVELARRGARVVVNDLGGGTDGTGAGTSAADLVVDEIVAAGGEAVASYDSVSTAEGGEAITQAALDAFGTVDIVINNAGTLRDKAFANLSAEDLRAIVDVHLFGAFHVTQPAFRVMKERGYGRILNTSSGAGVWGNFGQANYGAAKMGLVGLTNVLAVEGAKYGITANAIAPIAKSRLTVDLLGAMADGLAPELVMPLALYLVSEPCTLTHEVFSVGGGRFARAFVGLTPGWTADKGSAPSLEDVRDHLGEIRSEDGYIVPTSANDELALLAKVLA
jgi:NAD(P)-dependent dehydrogenase (short-subunit alcohol dehydrogenase family)